MSKTSVKGMKEGGIYWGDLNDKSIISNAKINSQENIITIDTKESDNYHAYSIVLKSEDGFSYKGKHRPTIVKDSEAPIVGSLFMNYYFNDGKHLLFGKWIEDGDSIICNIEMSE